MDDETPSRPTIALDTSTLLRSIPSRGPFRPIIEAFAAGRFSLVVSNEILFEYEEILKEKGGTMAWSSFDSLLKALRPSVRRVDPTYYWAAILHDPDDNKFVDAAVAGGADWIVTEDSHFDVLFDNAEITVRPLHPSLFIDRYLPSRR